MFHIEHFYDTVYFLFFNLLGNKMAKVPEYATKKELIALEKKLLKEIKVMMKDKKAKKSKMPKKKC